MELTPFLAQQCASRTFADLPASIVAATCEILLDSIASGLAGLHAAETHSTRATVSQWGGAGYALWGGHGTTAAPFAAFANAVCMGVMDFEDTDDGVPLHVCSVLLPVLMTELERAPNGYRGRDVLTALAVGIDASMRIGRAGGPKGSRGWNWGLISASMGSLLGVANLRRWDSTSTVSALGHLLSQLSGSLQAVVESSAAMRLLPGFAAQSVVMAAALAQARLPAPTQVLTGRAGLAPLYQEGQLSQAVLEEGIATCSLVSQMSLKQYPCCRFTHAALDLAAEVYQRGIRAHDIQAVEVLASKQTRNMVGKHLSESHHGILAAQFSLPYTLAAMLHAGQLGLEDFDQAAIERPHLSAFAHSHIAINTNPSIPSIGLLPVVLNLTLHNGERVQLQASEISGSPHAPLSRRQRLHKVEQCLRYARVPMSAQSLEQLVEQLQQDAPAATLIDALR